ncbi:Uncharacterised protein [uncultured archaeon]|nr:Uncharacterised protein [uncultured archaeon]
MSCCGSCGIEVPDGQRFCSMCYGDPYYGKDGYYLSELEREQEALQAYVEEELKR